MKKFFNRKLYLERSRQVNLSPAVFLLDVMKMQVVKDLMWLLQVGDMVHSLLADPNAILPTLHTTLERTALPLLAKVKNKIKIKSNSCSQMKLDGIEYRRNKSDTTVDLPLISASFLSMLSDHGCCVHVFVYVVCERVRKRDLVAATDWLKVLCSDVKCRQDVFLHSLCTAFHFSAIAPTPVSVVMVSCSLVYADSFYLRLALLLGERKRILTRIHSCQ